MIFSSSVTCVKFQIYPKVLNFCHKKVNITKMVKGVLLTYLSANVIKSLKKKDEKKDEKKRK